MQKIRNPSQWAEQYAWFFGCLGPQRGMDVKISVICPATEVHIRKVR
jgi:Scavenger mRNA decapping enzyme (DcpS) N-terminal